MATLGLLVVAYLLVTVISGIIQFPLLIIAEVAAPENALANGLAQGVGSTIGWRSPTLTVLIAIVDDPATRPARPQEASTSC